MPHVELPQLLFLVAVIASFCAFAIGLFAAQIYMLPPGRTAARPIRRQVTPNRREALAEVASGIVKGDPAS